MAEVIITVRGEHETRVAPERAIAHLTIRAEARERGTAIERIAALTEPVRDDLAARKLAGAVTEWSSQRASVWSARPWSNDGRQLAPVHYASVDFSVTFTDFTALSWWAGEVSERDGVQFGQIDWQLTPETRAATERDVATAAVGVAVARATAYAGALGLASLTPLEVADLGLLTGTDSPAGPPIHRALMGKAVFAAADSAGSGPAVQFQPEDIVVTAAVEARFAAR